MLNNIILTMFMVTLLTGCSSSTITTPDQGGGGDGGGQSQDPYTLQLVSFVPAESPIAVNAATAISFTAVIKLATRLDGSTQTITLATLSYKGTGLGQFQTNRIECFSAGAGQS